MKLNRIYQEDCLDTMKRMKDESIDFIITSPPYDNLRNYNGYSFDFEKISKELFRILKKGGVLIWVVGDATIKGSETLTSFKQAIYFKEVVGFNVHDTMLYYKKNPMPQTGKRYNQMFEYMFCLSKGQPKTFNPITMPCVAPKGMVMMKNRGKDGKLEYKKVARKPTKKVGNVFEYTIGGGQSSKDKIAFQHPAIFPEKLVEDQIITWTNEGDIVYDPFMGSGTTAKVASLTNRSWIGSELSNEYVAIALERLKENNIEVDD